MTKKMLLSMTAALALAGTVASTSLAQASILTIWNGINDGIASQNTAVITTPSGPPIGVYNYTGPINFVNLNGQNDPNLFSTFFGANTAFISPISGNSVATMLALPMSLTGDGIVTYLTIQGTYSAATDFHGFMTHDDGASLFLNGSNVNILPVNSEDETSGVTDPFTIPAGTGSFLLVYSEDNGAPSILQTELPNDPIGVPEPASLALFGGALLGLGLLRRRRPKAA